MGTHKLSQFWMVFATMVGVMLFLLNFSILFSNTTFTRYIALPVAFISFVYVMFIVVVILEPVKPLKEITKEEIEDHEYKRVIIDNDISKSFDSDLFEED
mmetsp:Transcript_35198/g.53941  ORF Transcript_35198/g.53941 Transcript_35198/m.53941 type:complete len:100 (-) Transcript_35198:22-321(-)